MKITQPSVPIHRLHEDLRYDPETGLLHWRMRKNQVATEGAVAGHKHSSRGKRYFRVRVDDTLMMGHWIVWAMVTGAWPSDQIDHEDGNGLNNRFNNLCIKPQSENNKNAAIRKDNVTGASGVTLSRCGSYVATIRVEGRLLHLGTFHSLDDAALVRREVEKVLGYHPNHGREQLYMDEN